MSWIARGTGRRVRNLVCCLPLLAAVQELGGVPTAEACAGSGWSDSPAWARLVVADAYPLTRVSVGTDGFVALEGDFYEGDTEAEVQLPALRATDETGNEVPGRVELLRSESRGDVTRVVLGWQSDEPLAVGTVLELTFSGRSADGGEGGAGSASQELGRVTLDVVEASAPLPTPSLTPGAWFEVGHGVGELVDCEANNSCGDYTLQVPTREVRLPAVEASWALPDFAGMVAWEVRTEASDPQNGVESSLQHSTVVARRREKTDVVDVGSVVFADDASDYCVVLVVKDLRTGDEARSEPRCDIPSEAEYERADHKLASCAEPPTPESVPFWCASHQSEVPCKASSAGAGGEGAGETPSGAEAGQGSGVGGVPGAGEPASAGEPAIANRARPRGGCQMAPAVGGIGLLTAAFGALFSLVARRRRAR